MRQMLPPDLGPSKLDRELYWCSRPEHEIESPKGKNRRTPPVSDYQYIEFRHAKFRECVKKGSFMPGLNVNAEKVDIFVTLCDVICDPNAEKPTPLCQYAAFHLIQHLKDIDRDVVPQWQQPSTKNAKKGLKDKVSQYMDMRATQPREIESRLLKRVGEALGRVLTNETGVSSMFEEILWNSPDRQIHFDLYDIDLSRSTNELVRAWVEKLTERDEKENLSLPTQIWTWAHALKKRPEGMLEDLAQGHLRSWAQKSTAEGAKVPYRLAYRALFNVCIWAPATTTPGELTSIRPDSTSTGREMMIRSTPESLRICFGCAQTGGPGLPKRDFPLPSSCTSPPTSKTENMLFFCMRRTDTWTIQCVRRSYIPCLDWPSIMYPSPDLSLSMSGRKSKSTQRKLSNAGKTQMPRYDLTST